GSTSTA
nr:Chain A, L-GSTSTA from ice nucleaction protein, inaZ [Pseudomonas syringae]6M7M_A Chain A, L-GSTSTA from ice nucleation protein, inaZ, and its enantiomer, D-GSTSTA [Pseudomonas syringae]6M9I_A Chain A, Ice nucleation protein [Pseudomonas syringae pv. syringae]6M9J_A Chain A, Ice nucleation protein [Pseudomonas syringae pv. syringae]